MANWQYSSVGNNANLKNAEVPHRVRGPTVHDMLFCEGPPPIVHHPGLQFNDSYNIPQAMHHPMVPAMVPFQHEYFHYPITQFETDYHTSRKRIIDMINQCRYLSSKKGMSKRELSAAIARDEQIGKFYDHAETFIPSTPKIRCIDPMYIDHPPPFYPYFIESATGVERGVYNENISPEQTIMFVTDQDEDLLDTNFDPVVQMPQVSSAERRPPTRRNVSGIPLVTRDKISSGKSLSGEDDTSSDESNFDPSEAADFIQLTNLNDNNEKFFNAVVEGNEKCSTAIPAIRKPGTHNFSLLLQRSEVAKVEQKIEKALNESDTSKPVADEVELTMYFNGCTNSGDEGNDSSSDDDDDATEYEENKGTTSFIKQRLDMINASETSLFGSFDDYGKMFMDSEDASVRQQDSGTDSV